MPQSTAMTAETIEGRILAHRRILGLILAEVVQSGAAPALLDALDDAQVMHDGQEDPGAVPDPALGMGLAMADETGEILAEMRRRMRPPTGPG